jgi:hypothetical protein
MVSYLLGGKPSYMLEKRPPTRRRLSIPGIILLPPVVLLEKAAVPWLSGPPSLYQCNLLDGCLVRNPPVWLVPFRGVVGTRIPTALTLAPGMGVVVERLSLLG